MNIVTEYGVILGYTPLVLYHFLPLATPPDAPYCQSWATWCEAVNGMKLVLVCSSCEGFTPIEWKYNGMRLNDTTPQLSLLRDSVRSGCYQCSTKCAHEQAQTQETVHYNCSCTWLVYVSINRETFPDGTKQHWWWPNLSDPWIIWEHHCELHSRRLAHSQSKLEQWCCASLKWSMHVYLGWWICKLTVHNLVYVWCGWVQMPSVVCSVRMCV